MALAVAEEESTAHSASAQADRQPHGQQDLPKPTVPNDVQDDDAGALPYNHLAGGGVDSIYPGEIGGSAVPIPTRRGLDSSPALFLWESRTTNVDVMSVSNTTRPVAFSSSRNSERRRIQVVLPYGDGSAATGRVAANGGGHRGGGASSRAGGGGVAGMTMGLLDPPNATALEARLNEVRWVKRGRDLRRERHIFLSRLTQEREERVLLEAWAASRIQAMFRGFLVRPRPPLPRPRQKLTRAESNRRLVADLQGILAGAGLPTIPGLGPDGRKASDCTAWGRGPGGSRSSGIGTAGGAGRGGGRGLKRSRSRKQRAFEDEMATRITKVVRGYLERRRFGRRWAEWDRKRLLTGVSLIQYCWRAFRKRMGWRELESEVMSQAATRVQASWRGMSCRMGLARRATEDALRKRRTISAITIQTAARRRAAIVRYGSKLTLGAARRKREARAAAEAARPRRRWNRGGAPTAGGAATGAASATEAGDTNGLARPVAPAKGGGVGGPEDRATVVGAEAAVADSGGGREKELPTAVAKSSPKNAGEKNRRVSDLRPSAAPLKKGLERQQQRYQESASGWEDGPSTQKIEAPSCGAESEGSVAGHSTTTGTDSTNSRSRTTGKPEGGGNGGNGGGTSGDGDSNEKLSGLSSSDTRARASQDASLRFVRDSIQAAVANTRKYSWDKHDGGSPDVAVISADDILAVDITPATSSTLAVVHV